MNRRVLTILSAAVLLAGCGTPPAGGTARDAGLLEASRKVKPTAIAFEQLVVNQVEALRDGGTIVAKGYVTRSTHVTIKYDGALASKTRGTILVESHDFMATQGQFRPALAEELAALPKALRGNAARAGANLDLAALERLAEAAEKAAGGDEPPAGGDAVVTGLVIEKKPVRCPCFRLTGKLGGKALAIEFEGMPGGYAVTAITLGGRGVAPAERPAIGKALLAAAPEAGSRAGMVEELAEVLGGK